MKTLINRFAAFSCAWICLSSVNAAIIRWDLSHLNLVTPASEGDETNFGNTAIGVWFNMQSGEAYVVEDTGGITGKTDVSDGRFQLRWTTYWALSEGGKPSSDILIQGELPFNSVHAISTGTPDAAAGSPARLGVGESVPTGAAFRPVTFVEMAGTYGVWNELGRGFLALRFLANDGNFSLHFGFADITFLADGRMRLNGIAYNSEPNQSLVTEYIGAPAPESASNLQVASTSASSVSLIWQDNAEAETGFIIQRRGTGDPEFVQVAQTLPDVVRYTDAGLTAASAYTYRVIATTGLDAEPSNEVVAQTQSVDRAPNTPSLTSVTPLSPSSLRIEWVDTADNEVQFRIERQESGQSWSTAATLPAGSTTLTDTGLNPGTTYAYRIIAANGLDSAPSEVLQAATFSPRVTAGIESMLAAYPSLDGAGVEIGLWDFAPALSTHVEFGGGAVINIEGGEAGSDPLSNHTTHGAGIITASGFNLLAKGLAPASRVLVYHMENDQAEMRSIGMATPNQTDSVQVSVAAYGPIRGWNPLSGGPGKWAFNADAVDGVRPVSDSSFAAYTTFSQEADATAWLRPYLLQVRSAGNDRDDVPAPGDFVFLSNQDFAENNLSVYNPAIHPGMDGADVGGLYTVSDAAAAKNPIAVGPWSGAYRNPATGMLEFVGEGTHFGNWGPTRDGRVKPDLVAPGVGIFSASYAANDAYSTLTGSSQAAPHVAAVAGLLTQYWANSGLSGALRASTLKGLLIHSADDLGTVGPDPQTGWGLLNARAAVDTLAQYNADPASSTILEGFYDGAPISLPYTANGGPLKVTLVWTDPESTPSTGSGPHLVHDLDLRVITSNGGSLLPYVLATDVDNLRVQPAQRGDNAVDPNEQIFADSVTGPITVSINLKGNAPNAPLPFSMVISGASYNGPMLPRAAQVFAGAGTLEILGDGFQLGARVTLHHSSGSRLETWANQVGYNRIFCNHGGTPLADGFWVADIQNPDGSRGSIRWWQGGDISPNFPTWFENWLDAQFGSNPERFDPVYAATNSDPDGDGFSQLTAYAMGASNGSVPVDFRPVVRPIRVEAASWIEVQYSRRTSGDVALQIHSSASPNGPWTQPQGLQITSVIQQAEGVERVTVRWPAQATSGDWLQFAVSLLP